MVDLGLEQRDLDSVCAVLESVPAVEQAIVFGSRAKGNFKLGSDVDLVLKGENLTFEQVSHISYLLNEETSMPYRFDVLAYKTIASPELLAHIDRVGVVVFRRHKEE
jgi:predicted nucleotidyltransferase